MAYVRINNPFFQSFVSSDIFNEFGTVDTYLSETSDREPVFSDNAGTPHENPLTLDSIGRAEIWVDTRKLYRFVVRDASGNLVDDSSFLAGINGGSGGSVTLPPISARSVLANATGLTAAPTAVPLNNSSVDDANAVPSSKALYDAIAGALLKHPGAAQQTDNVLTIAYGLGLTTILGRLTQVLEASGLGSASASIVAQATGLLLSQLSLSVDTSDSHASANLTLLESTRKLLLHVAAAADVPSTDLNDRLTFEMQDCTGTSRQFFGVDQFGNITLRGSTTAVLPFTVRFGNGETTIHGEEIVCKEIASGIVARTYMSASADGTVSSTLGLDITNGTYSGSYQVRYIASTKCVDETVSVNNGRDTGPCRRLLVVDRAGTTHQVEQMDQYGKRCLLQDLSIQSTSVDNGFTVAELTFPLVIGHRGCYYINPENTIDGFLAAAKSGVQLIEIDVHLAGDGALVVMHDNTLTRCCGASVNTEDISSAYIGRYKVVPQLINSVSFANWPTALELPTLDRIFEIMKPYDVCFMIDAKSTVGDGAGFAACAEAACQCVLRHKLRQRCIVAGFSLEVGLRAIANGIMAGYASDTGAYDPATLYAAGYSWYDISDAASESNIIAACAIDGLRVAVYSGNNHYDRDRWFALGVDAYFGNDPTYMCSAWVPKKKDGYRFGTIPVGSLSGYGTSVMASGGLDVTPGISSASLYASRCIGSMSPVPVASYKATAQVLIAETYNTSQGIHLLFLNLDKPYNFLSGTSYDNGYLLSISCLGSINLYRMTSGVNTLIGSASSAALVLGSTIVILSLEFSGNDIIVTRSDGDVVTFTVSSETVWRPRYFHVGAKSCNAHFSNMEMVY